MQLLPPTTLTQVSSLAAAVLWVLVKRTEQWPEKEQKSLRLVVIILGAS